MTLYSTQIDTKIVDNCKYCLKFLLELTYLSPLSSSWQVVRPGWADSHEVYVVGGMYTSPFYITLRYCINYLFIDQDNWFCHCLCSKLYSMGNLFYHHKRNIAGVHFCRWFFIQVFDYAFFPNDSSQSWKRMWGWRLIRCSPWCWKLQTFTGASYTWRRQMLMLVRIRENMMHCVFSGRNIML